MGDDVLAGNHRLVQDIELIPLPCMIFLNNMPRPSIGGASPQTSGATARTPGILPELVSQRGRNVAEHRARHVLA